MKRKQDEGGDASQVTNKEKTLRKRATVACEECRARKRRCDGAVPACGACMKRMTQCIYASEIEARQWRSQYVQCSFHTFVLMPDTACATA